jgi:hypothetical protein
LEGAVMVKFKVCVGHLFNVIVQRTTITLLFPFFGFVFAAFSTVLGYGVLQIG